MKTTHQLTLLSALSAMTLSGCASADERYPSLDIRPAERALGTLEPATPDSMPIPLTTEPRSIQSALDRALAADADFAAQKAEARDLVTAASEDGIESDRRARALVALAGLTSLRGQTAIALADLDALEVAAATELAETSAIRTAQASVTQIITSQDEALDSLAELLTP